MDGRDGGGRYEAAHHPESATNRGIGRPYAAPVSFFGRPLGEGLFEFRILEDGLPARAFCHAYGERLILLLGAYDKGKDPSERRQNQEIKVARGRLKAWKTRQQT